MLSHGASFRDFIAASPTSYHAARNVAQALVDAGFTESSESQQWDVTPGGHVVVHGGAVIAYVIPDDGELSEFRIVGAHTDSPAFKVKPKPDMHGYGFSQVAVETYGGLLLNSWLNRDLGIAGRITTVTGEDKLFATGPLMFIPQLAPHLDRSVDQNLSLNRQTSLQPIWATGERSVVDVIAQAAGVSPDAIGGMDAYSYDTQIPVIINDEFIAGGRQDNLTSVHAALHALLEAEKPGSGVVNVFIANDHEEVGSSTTTGAAGPLLEWALRRTALAMGCNEERYYQVIARSTCISSDAGHSINPNYASYYDPTQFPVMGKGPMVKVNANQRYASDSRGIAMWERAARSVDAPHQSFVSNNAVPCGSTIGPITATRLGVETVDVGVPLLSMHSVREVSAVRDNYALTQILRGYWNLA